MNCNKVKQLIEQRFSDPYKPSHQKGPDYVIPSKEIRTWLPEGATKIQLTKKNEFLQPKSVITFFRGTVDRFPDNDALVVKRDGELKKWNYTQYWDQVRIIAKGFIKLGLLPFHGVGILGYNSPEWLISHLGTIFAGGFSAGIYTTNSPDACYHVLNDCEANIVVVDDETQLDKVLKIRHKLPNLKAIVQYLGTPKHPDVYSWDDVLQIGLSVSDDILEKRIKGLAVNQCCILLYTSGTTGDPKGVMLSHDNMTYHVRFFTDSMLPEMKGDGSCVSYLPLSHIAALALDLFIAMHRAAAVHFAPADALKGSLVKTLVEVKPVGFAGVPRVFEKIAEKIKNEEVNMNIIKRYMFLWAKSQAAKYHSLGKMKPVRKPILLTLANKLVLDKVKKLLGFECAKYVCCGGAPLSLEVQEYFISLDIPIIEGYGMSESCGVHVANDIDDIKVGTVGNAATLTQYEFKIHNPDENGCGEILLRGRNIFMGYLKLKDKTIETIDDEWWLHSGDIGTIDKFGSLRITGRIKELIITSGGENIPPVIIEDEIKNLLPVVSNCMLVGDNKKYLTILLTLKTDLDMDTLLPTDMLSLSAVKWCKDIGTSAKAVTEIIKSNDKLVMTAIQRAVDKYNEEKAISNAQKIQKWTILPLDFSIPNGELGPTAKLRRQFILEKYSNEIDKMYST